MSRRKRSQPEEPEAGQPEPPADDPNAWDAPEFRRSVGIDLAFVAAPAVVMMLLGEYAIAAAWFGVGAAVIAWQVRRQIRDFLRSLR